MERGKFQNIYIYICVCANQQAIEHIPCCCLCKIFLVAKRDTEIFEISVANEISITYLES